MLFNQENGLKYYQFDIFKGMAIDHGVFSRHGGVSPFPWDELNLSTSTGDTSENIIENRRLVLKALRRDVISLYDVWQIHSDTVIHTEQPRGLDVTPLKADAIITRNPNVTLIMRFADCVPILLFDPVQNAIGIAHAGWQGTVKQITAKTVMAMGEKYGSKPKDIFAAIGPSIGPDHYEVGQDVIIKTKEAFKEQAEKLLEKTNGSIHLNLWESNKLALQKCGVQNIQCAELCTACHIEDWYSHRGEKEKNGKTGRFCAVIALRKPGE